MVRILSIIGVALASVLLPWWLVMPLWVVYAYRLPAYELLVLGALCDAYYGVASGYAYYTAAALVIVAGMEFLKPYLVFHEERG